MPVHHAIWRVGDNPQPLTISKLASEQLLEKMILNDPTIISDQWMIIGHQENTLDKGRIDLLAQALALCRAPLSLPVVLLSTRKTAKNWRWTCLSMAICIARMRMIPISQSILCR
ncbi:Uncharacterised protein [Serratia quinivorans]|nr:Uncharacterised protein [Serratia quinivorans]CAI1748159.1 Uncharacterised protein [Serratia quinivorans]